MAKNVVLKDSSGNELNPKTTIEQVGLTAGSDGKLDGSSISDSSITSDKVAWRSHNSMLRGKDITSYLTDGSLWDRIHGTNGYSKFQDLYLGDYFDMGQNITCPDSHKETIGSRYCVIAGFNCLYGNGSNNEVTYDHIICVPGTGDILHNSFGIQHFGCHAMNPTATTEGGYAGSAMHLQVYGADSNGNAVTNIAGTINAQLYTIFGSHLKATKELLSTEVNTTGYNRLGAPSGCSNKGEFKTCYAVNMSEIEVYGSTVWSSSGYDTGTAKERLPLFGLSEGAINDRGISYWLKDVVSASYFALVSRLGNADCKSAGNYNYSVRPRFVLS